MTDEINYKFDPNDLAYRPEDSPEERSRRINRACRHPDYAQYFYSRVSGVMPAVEAKDISRRTHEGIKATHDEEKEKENGF